MRPASTVPDLLRRNTAERGDVRAVVTADRAVTHAELDARSRAVAARLLAAGVVPSSRVGLHAPNDIEWVVAALAVTRLGAVLVPLSTVSRPPELLEQLRVAEVGHLLTVAELRGRSCRAELEAAAPGVLGELQAGRRHRSIPTLGAVLLLEDLTRDGAALAPAASAEVAARERRVHGDSDLAVLFTSGSSGLPKGVLHTHGAALGAVAAGLDVRCVRDGDVLYTPMPFFWTGGFSGGLVTTLVAGITLLTDAVPEPRHTLALLARERVTLFRGWPDQAARLAAHPDAASTDLSSLREGSLPALLPPELRPAPGARANLFGMTETFGPYCGEPLDTDLPIAQRGSCGRPLPGMEVRIVDPADGRPRGPGEPGEIWLRGPQLLRAICGRDDHEVFTADGCFRTGDLGALDDAGYLFFHGRLDDMFKVRGATVYPSEVESALRGLDLVRHAHVTRVDGAEGAEVGALVVVDEGVDVDRVVAALRPVLSAFKVPTRWVLVTDPAAVPMLASSKVDRVELRRMLADPRGA